MLETLPLKTLYRKIVYPITRGIPIKAIINITVRVNWLEEELEIVKLKAVLLEALTRLGKWAAPTIPHKQQKIRQVRIKELLSLDRIRL